MFAVDSGSGFTAVVTRDVTLADQILLLDHDRVDQPGQARPLDRQLRTDAGQ